MEIVHIKDLLWTPIRTKAKREKKLAEYCKHNDITYYLPLRKSIKRYGRKTITFYPPMFPGYIFCQLNLELYTILVKSHDVFYKVDIDEASEIQLIEDLIGVYKVEKLTEQDNEVIIKPELTTGKPVIITQGPMQGTKGIISKRENEIIVTVNVEILGHSVSVKVDVGEVEIEKN